MAWTKEDFMSGTVAIRCPKTTEEKELLKKLLKEWTEDLRSPTFGCDFYIIGISKGWSGTYDTDKKQVTMLEYITGQLSDDIYISPVNLFDGEIKAGTPFQLYLKNAYIPLGETDLTYALPREIVETWEKENFRFKFDTVKEPIRIIGCKPYYQGHCIENLMDTLLSHKISSPYEVEIEDITYNTTGPINTITKQSEWRSLKALCNSSNAVKM